MPLWRTAQLLNLHRDLAVGSRRLKATTLAHLVMEMVKHFCYSTDEQVTARHLGTVNGLDDAGQQYVTFWDASAPTWQTPPAASTTTN